MTIIAFILLAYLLGSIPFAVVTSRIFGLPDPRAYGSRNPGATNVLRSGKGVIALLTLMGDAGKGWLAVVLAQHFVPIFGLGKEVIVAVSLAVFLGHIFSVFLCFKGGRGVATAVGVLLGLSLWVGLLAIATWILVMIIWRISSLSALVAAIMAPVYAWMFLDFEASILVILIMSLLLIWRHKSNISRLLAGKEARIDRINIL
ncbi:MAG: glycerol-3-phosphate 1-O-acyltransferase PlsY [Nitrosospira sp.]|nr:glycerol-3-phosphate 1-O-acyltransferase PlsY [Nitrosospira sp.]